MLVSVTIRVYVVVVVGLATGLGHPEQLNVAEGLQLYVPPPVALSVVIEPELIVTSGPASGMGGLTTAFTTCIIESLLPVQLITTNFTL